MEDITCDKADWDVCHTLNMTLNATQPLGGSAAAVVDIKIRHREVKVLGSGSKGNIMLRRLTLILQMNWVSPVI